MKLRCIMEEIGPMRIESVETGTLIQYEDEWVFVPKNESEGCDNERDDKTD